MRKFLNSSAASIFTHVSAVFIVQDSSQLKDLWKKICHNSTGMEFQDHRYWLRTYPNCIVGKELVNWLLRNGTISTRYQFNPSADHFHPEVLSK